MVGIIVAGLLLMLVARFGLKSWFFQMQRESDPGAGAERTGRRTARAGVACQVVQSGRYP